MNHQHLYQLPNVKAIIASNWCQNIWLGEWWTDQESVLPSVETGTANTNSFCKHAMSSSSTFSNLFGNFPLWPSESGAAGWCNRLHCVMINQKVSESAFQPTWRSPWFVLAQLSTAVRTTCVHTAILQQEYRVLASTRYIFQSPAIEHLAVSWLK